jgi:uncharacterized protein YqjF (DUF2071 family)
MKRISDSTFSEIDHRPWPIPQNHWLYYQEWNEAHFLHWKIPPTLLKPLLPPTLKADEIDNACYISLVAFTMNRIRPRFLPSLSLISRFHEVNLRTYVVADNKPGVYFLSIEAGKRISSFLAKSLSGLPYTYSDLRRSEHCYEANHPAKSSYLKSTFIPGSEISENEKSPLEIWLTERYALYLDVDDALYRYEIHHKPWKLQNVTLRKLDVSYEAGEMTLNHENLHSAHYSPGVQVVSWPRERIL